MEFVWTNGDLSNLATFVNVELERQRRASVVDRVLRQYANTRRKCRRRGQICEDRLCHYLPYIKQHLQLVDSQKCRSSGMNLIKMYGENIQKIKMNQVCFELRDFLPFAIRTQSYK